MNHQRAFLIWPLLLLIALVTSACSSHFAESHLDFDSDCWSMHDTVRVEFGSADTQQVYQLTFPMVFTEDYAYNNIYLRAAVKSPSGELNVLPARFELQESNGAWLSPPNGEEISFELGIGDGLRFNQEGIYTLMLYQYMRDEPLCGIRSAGLVLGRVQP